MDFDGLKQEIKVDSYEQYLKLMPLLNQKFNGWKPSNMCNQSFPRYIRYKDDLRDFHDKKSDRSETIPASEYLVPPEVLIFN